MSSAGTEAGAQVGRDAVSSSGRGTGRRDLVQLHEVVDQAGLAAQLHIDARVAQSTREGLGVLAQRVVLGRDDQRARRDALAHGRHVQLGERRRRLRDELGELRVGERSGHPADGTSRTERGQFAAR